MTTLTRRFTRDLFPQDFSRLLIGFDNMLDEVEFPDPKYPPYNIIRQDNDNYVIEMAVAGFDPSDISVKTQNGILKITAEKKAGGTESNYLYRGVATRDFVRCFKLYEHLFIKSAEFVNGMLRITLERRLPEHLKEQSFPVKVITS